MHLYPAVHQGGNYQMETPFVSSSEQAGLRANTLGFPELLAQSIALISPTMTAVLIIPLAFSNAGEGTWMAYLFGTVMLLFVVFGLNQFARRSTSAGSMYAYTGRGLGAASGVISGWTLIWSYLFIGIAGLNGFTIFAGQFLSALGFTGTIPPLVFYLISGIICWLLAYKDIRLSSILMLVLEGLSVLCILTLAVVVLFFHGFSFDTAQITLKGVTPDGMSLAVVAAIFSLVGFESATAMGSEAKKPLRTIPRAVIWSLILTGLFFVLMSYVEVYGTRNYSTPLSALAAPLNTLSDLYKVNFFKIPLSLGAMVSFFSLSLSCLNAGARIIFPMAQHSVFPKPLARVHPVNKTPAVAITVYILIMLLVPGLLSLSIDPLTIFNDAGTFAAFGFLLAYFLITIASPVYLARRKELRPVNIAVAILGCLFLLVPTIGSFYPVPAWPVNIYPYIFLAYMAVGGTWLFIVSRRYKGILTEIEVDMEKMLQASSEPHVKAEKPVIIGDLAEQVGD
jgi:amino acid transporter